MLLLRYLIQRKQNGTDGNAFSYEAGPNATDEFEGKGGVDAYIEQVSAFTAIAVGKCSLTARLWLTPSLQPCQLLTGLYRWALHIAKLSNNTA